VDLRQEGHAAGGRHRERRPRRREDHVDRSKDEIKNAPEFDDSMVRDEGYRTRLGSYYYDEAGR
jgi:hypothetical protein